MDYTFAPYQIERPRAKRRQRQIRLHYVDIRNRTAMFKRYVRRLAEVNSHHRGARCRPTDVCSEFPGSAPGIENHTIRKRIEVSQIERSAKVVEAFPRAFAVD